MASTQLAEPCRLLALPAELRNHVYELVATKDEEEDTMNLFTATPPGTALLQLNRQIRMEAKGFVTQAAERYWSTTHFIIDVSDINAAFHTLDRLGNSRISLLTRMTICGDPKKYLLVWELNNRVWSYRHPEYTGRPQDSIVVVGDKTKDPAFRYLDIHGDKFEGGVFRTIRLEVLALDRVDEAKMLYSTATLTRSELQQVMVLCTGDWR